MKALLSGIWHQLKKSNYYFKVSEKKITEIMSKFPYWQKKQINNEFLSFKDEKIDVDQTLENLKKNKNFLKLELLKITIKENKIFYENYLKNKFHPRFIRLKNFLKRCSKLFAFPNITFLYSISDTLDDFDISNKLKAPIFCISKKMNSNISNKIILFPHIEWIEKNDKLIDSIKKEAVKISWDKKKDQVFWRGTSTGFENLNKNERFKIVKFSKRYPDVFDVYFSSVLPFHEKEIDKQFIISDKFPPYLQIKYKYLLAIDGNAFAGSFFWQLFSNSIVFKNKSSYLEWYYSGLKKDEHYIEYEDEKDLVNKLILLDQNVHSAKKIIKNANIFANANLSNENIICYVKNLLTKYREFCI